MDHCGTGPLTVTVYYTSHGHINQKVLNTKSVYESQTGLVVADEINGILGEFQLKAEAVAATVNSIRDLCPFSTPGSIEGSQH